MTTQESATKLLDEKVFVENMRELWRFDPKLALALDRLEEADLPQLEPTRTAAATVRRATPDGKTIYLHSRYDPLAEAEKWCARAIEKDKFCYFIEGFALGHHIKGLFDRLIGDIILVVLEPDLQILRLGLSSIDFAEEIRSRRLTILTEPDKNRVHQQLALYQGYILMGTRIVSHQPSVRICEDLFRELRQLCMNFIEYTKTAVVTLVTNSQATCQNIADNLATYLATPPINELKSRFAGHAAILVSAGPSLRKNMQQLAEVTDKAVIIAVQSTFKPLLNGGIVPHFVCSLDYHELSRQFYEDIDDFHGVHLVAEPKAHHSVIDAYGGPISLLSNEFAKTVLAEAHDQRDGLLAGASVAHLAFYLAEYMGCDPIIMIGQDLALTHHVYYAPGMAIHAVWQAETNRFCTMEMKEWERILRRTSMLRKVKDQDGNDIYTEELMFNYLEQFEKDFAKSSCRIIDATEGGARKQGTEVLPLREAIRQHCTRRIDPQRFAYRSKKPWFDPSPLADGRAQVRRRLQEIQEIAALCDETLEVLDELRNLVDRPAAFNAKIKKVDQLRLKVREHERAYNIISSGAQLAEFRKFSADQKLKASTAVGSERAHKQLDRDMEFVRSLQGDTQRMIAILENAESRFGLKMDQYAAL